MLRLTVSVPDYGSWKNTIFRQEATSALAGYHADPGCILVDLEFGDAGFCGGRKKPSKQGENLRQTQPKYDTWL